MPHLNLYLNMDSGTEISHTIFYDMEKGLMIVLLKASNIPAFLSLCPSKHYQFSHTVTLTNTQHDHLYRIPDHHPLPDLPLQG